MKEYKILFYVTCFLTMTTSEAQPTQSNPLTPATSTYKTNSSQTPIIYTKQTSTPRVEIPTESKPSVSPTLTKTPKPILSPTVNDIQPVIATSANQVVSTEKLPATSEKLTAKPVKMPVQTITSTLQPEPLIITDAPADPVIYTAKLSATSKMTYKTHAPSTSAQELMRDTPTTTPVVPIAKVPATTNNILEKLTTKLADTTTFRTPSSTMHLTSAQNVMTEKTTTQHAPTAKLSATTQNTSEKLTTKLADTTNFGTQSTTTRPTTTVQKTTKAAKTCGVCPPVIPEVQTTEPPKYDKDHEEKAILHGKIVAGIIAGSLLAMMVGFLVILYKKHKLKKHQIATTDWAGPTPFLETGETNGHVTLRSANRISLTSFLPQRLSKRLSLLAESGEEMQDMQSVTTPTTFVGKEEKKVENVPKVDKIDKSELEKTEKIAIDKNEKSEGDKIDKSATETAESKSESSTKTDNVVLVDEKDKNGEIKNKESQLEQAKNETGKNEASDNKSSEPATAENPSKEPNKETKEQTGKEGADNVA